MKRYLIIFFLFFGAQAYAQNNTDSMSITIRQLKSELENQSDEEKVATCIKISQLYAPDSAGLAIRCLYRARLLADKIQLPEVNLALSELYFQKQNIDSMLFLLEEAIEISEGVNINSETKKTLYNRYAEALYYKSDYKRSNQYYKKAGQICLQQNDSVTYSNALIDRSYIYEFWGQRDSALLLLENVLSISEKIDYTEGVARASMGIGNLYYGLDNWEKALGFYKKALQAAQKINNVRGIGIIRLNIGMIYIETGDNDRAEQNIIQAIEMLKQSESFIQLALAYDDLAIIYSKKGDKKKVDNYLQLALQLQKKYADKQEVAIGYNVHADCYSRLKDYKKSNTYLDSCIAIASQTNFKLMLQKSYRLYAENLKALNQYKLAYQYIEKSSEVQDSILSENFQKQLAEFDVKYKTLEKQSEIERLQSEEKLQKANFRNLLMGSLSIFFILVLVAYYYVLQRKRQKEIDELKMAKLEMESKQLANQLELKNKELTTHALNMVQKNKMLSGISNSIVEIINSSNGDMSKNLKSLKRNVESSLQSEKEWNIFKTYFEQVNEGFIQQLNAINPQLSNNEVRLSTLLKLNMTNKEIASILNITHQSVKNAQYRLKGKLKIPANDDLRSFLLKL